MDKRGGDSVNPVNTGGDQRQELNSLVQEYAKARGIIFAIAWVEFKKAYNTAYHTNLELSLLNYRAKTKRKKITIPDYLETTGKIPQAIMVMKALLQRKVG